MSRKLTDLTPEMQKLYLAFDAHMRGAGIDYIVTCTRRTQEEQDALWEIGRTKPGRKVTWTRNSYHLTGKAFDIVIMENGKPEWQVENPDWMRAGEIGESIGLEWAGRFKRCKEFPHFQIT